MTKEKELTEKAHREIEGFVDLLSRLRIKKFMIEERNGLWECHVEVVKRFDVGDGSPADAIRKTFEKLE